VQLVRRSSRMARRGFYCPPMQAEKCPDATAPVTTVKPHVDLTGRAVTKVSNGARAVAQSNNQFAFDLYKSLRDQEGNRFFSPASIATALAMTYAGAAGETRQQMADVLHLNLPDLSLHNGFGTLNSILNTKNERYRLNMANRLWGQSGFHFEPQFVRLIHEHYGAGLGEVDFAATEQARQTINRWVAESTNGKIADLIPPGILTDKTRFVLTNAIYFKGTWTYQFSKSATQEAPFYLSKNRKIDVPMMQQHTGGLRYAQTENIQLLEMPYAGGNLSMLVLLPRQVDGLPQLEEEVTANGVQKWSSGLRDDYDVTVYLPKFTFTSQTGLKDELSSLGMPAAFSDQAEFPGISRQKKQKLFDALHQAFVDVNEEGTEAGAATGHIGGDLPGPVPQEAVFRADHPFLFLIQDRRTGAILFLGRVVNPIQ
ncbi:MAG TPA: serpin family protein, partial [Planctomycetaceae bacterium]